MKLIRDNDPNYKIIDRGSDSLSDVEILSVVISGRDSVEKARNLFSMAGNNYGNLTKMSYFDMKLAGLSHNQTTRLLASTVFGKRRRLSELPELIQIKCSKDVSDIMNPIFEDLICEEFWMLFLNRNNRVIGKFKLSQGGLNGTVTDVRIMMKKAIEYLASGIIVCHNHPSGNLNPSESDTKITQKIKEVGNLMDIQLLDHIIISDKNFYSFADNGLL